MHVIDYVSQCHPASKDFNGFLQETMTTAKVCFYCRHEHIYPIFLFLQESDRRAKLKDWKKASGALACHPREEHLVPAFVISGSGGTQKGEVIYEENTPHFVSSFKFL